MGMGLVRLKCGLAASSLCLALFLLSGCFFGGKEAPGSIKGYKNNTVFLKQGSYRVGELPHHWRQVHFKYKTLLFRHLETQASISTNAVCGESTEDASLQVLTRHLYNGIDQVKIESQAEKPLDGRSSLWTVWGGQMDGVPVKIETVSIKKNECLFDFYYVALPPDFEKGQKEFHHFAQGFSYP